MCLDMIVHCRRLILLKIEVVALHAASSNSVINIESGRRGGKGCGLGGACDHIQCFRLLHIPT